MGCGCNSRNRQRRERVSSTPRHERVVPRRVRAAERPKETVEREDETTSGFACPRCSYGRLDLACRCGLDRGSMVETGSGHRRDVHVRSGIRGHKNRSRSGLVSKAPEFNGSALKDKLRERSGLETGDETEQRQGAHKSKR